ncbi:MAG: hypothetical protein Q9163_003521 [Psora crenata]
MICDVRSPRPVKPLKRTLDDIDLECTSAKKRLRPASLQTPSPTYDQLSDVPRPSSTQGNCPITPLSNRQSSTAAQSKAVNARKRFREDSDAGCAPANKRPRPLSPTQPTIYNWLTSVPRTSSPPSIRPSSAPAQFSVRETLVALDDPIYQPRSLATIQQMLQSQGQSLGRGFTASTQTQEPSTCQSLYRSLLYNNGICMDHTGGEMPKEIREMMDTHILKGWSSPSLPEKKVLDVIRKAVSLANSAEPKVTSLIRTDMLPLDRPGLGEGGNTLWSTDVLPYDPTYEQPVAAPKPDYHYGYPAGTKSVWSRQANAVVDHPVAAHTLNLLEGISSLFLHLS